MKVMVNRIKPFLTSIISLTQSSFIPGQGCHDNIIIVQEAIHSLKNCKGRVGNFAMKIDLEKAYDRIEWSFLECVLRDVGIPESWISLIMFCVSTSSFSLLWNGEKTEPFTPRRGLRQGDPLSPYLFVLCLDKLSQMIENATRTKQWNPFRITRKGPSLCHLFFADDLVFFGKATINNMRTLMDCLQSFCNISGQKVNASKSKIFFSPNTNRGLIDEITQFSRIEATDDLGRYLGVPLHHKRVTRATYYDLLLKVKTKLSSWKAAQLSFAGRQVLIKSVSSTVNIIQLLELHVLNDQNLEMDSIYWKSFSTGEFSTMSAYELLTNSSLSPLAGCWSKVWSLIAPPKAKSLLWLMLHDRVLTNSARFARGIAQNDTCPRCYTH
ncbi:hypothetical protein SLA2020_063760 [Shorea laevis]